MNNLAYVKIPDLVSQALNNLVSYFVLLSSRGRGESVMTGQTQFAITPSPAA